MTSMLDGARAVAGHQPRPKPTGTRRLRGLGLVVSIAGVAFGLAPASPAAAVATSRFGYQGHSFGTYVSGSARSGPSAVSALGCGPLPGTVSRNTTAGTAVGGTLSSATLHTSARAGTAPDETASTASAQDVSLLGGRVTAQAVRSVSTTSHDGSGYHTSAAGSSFTNLVVLGSPVVTMPAPNTVVPLPGIGHIVLNEQHSTMTATGASLDVWALHAVVDQMNSAGFAVGTGVTVAGAFSAMTPPVGGFLTGFAYGTQGHLAPVVGTDPSFLELMPCGGTGGTLRTNTGAAGNAPGVVTSRNITDTARGSTTSTTATAETTSSLANVNMLNGLVKASGVKADAHASRAGGQTTVSDAGSMFGYLIVNGHHVILDHLPANVALPVSGLGTLYLHRTIVTPTSIEVRMIEIVVTMPNSYGLPVGADIRAAVAGVGAH